MNRRGILGGATCAAIVLAIGCGGETVNDTRAAQPVAGTGVQPIAGTGVQQPIAGNGAPAPTAGSFGTGTPVAPGETPPTGAAGALPCDVASVLQSDCHQCHGETPIGGAIRLVTQADFHQQSPLYDPTKKVYEVAKIRINNGEMPQGRQMPVPDLAVLDSWLTGGALAAPAVDPTCNATTVTPDPVDPVANPPVSEGGVIDNCLKPGAYDPPVARPGETCHEFPVVAPGTNSAFTVPTAESYHEWYYAVPWSPTDVWTRFGAAFDNLQVLHHYLIFTSGAPRSPGDVALNVTGTTLGTNATLIGGWAVGGCNTENPADVGGLLPPSPLIMVQWHMYNTTGVPARDNSKVRVCTVPAGTRPHTAGITFLGTENFNGPLGMPPGANSFTTRCTNNSGAPITVIGFNPHMHLLGTNMKTDLISGGAKTTIFDMPFQFDYQVGYEVPPATVNAGDTLETTCSFFNDTGANVAFGESTNQEMCYQFALSYPASALDNGTLSLIGALNTCW